MGLPRVRRMVGAGRWRRRRGPSSHSSLSSGREGCREMIPLQCDWCIMGARKSPREPWRESQLAGDDNGGQMLGRHSGEVRSNIWAVILGRWQGRGNSISGSHGGEPSLLQERVDVGQCQNAWLAIQAGTDYKVFVGPALSENLYECFFLRKKWFWGNNAQ